jgi:hypothetical protein
MAAFTMRKYTLPAELTTAFTPAELQDLKQHFHNFDTNKDGTIDANELGSILTNCGETFDPAELPALVAELDTDHNGSISFGEFAAYIHSLRHGGKGDGKVAKAMKRTTGLLKVEGAGGASHMFSEEEKIAFSEHINNCLRNDPHAGRHLPLDPDSYQLFERAGDGLIFWYPFTLPSPSLISTYSVVLVN